MTGHQPRENIRPSRISDAERQAMLDNLDALEEKNPAKNKRGMPRVAFRKNEIAVRIHHPGGSASASYVTTRNLSAGGMSFLYHGFLHKNTKVEIVLRRRLGGDDVIRGIVQHCALVNRTYHLIGTKFDQKIFPKLYLDPSEWGELDDATTVDRATLQGNVLHLDDQEMDRLLMQHFLKGTKINLISVGTTDEAMARIKEGGIDCVLCDLILMDGADELAVSRLRKGGYTGPIALVTAETSAPRIKQATDAGASAVLSKPFDASKLTSLLATWLSAGTSGEEPIVSAIGNNPETAGLVEQYVTRLRTLAREMRKHIENNNLEGVRQACQMVRGSAAGFGFQILSDLARDAVHCLDSSQSVKDSAMQVQQLEAACFRAAATSRAG